jgi:hypothetical protein
MSVLKLQNLQPRTTSNNAVGPVSVSSSHSSCCTTDPK